MESFEKVITNVDLLTLIFNYLDFKDQLRLAQVNDQFRCVFEALSGNVNYSSLGIFQQEHPRCDFHFGPIFVAGEMGVNRKFLESAQVLDDFLELYADTVHDLTLWNLEYGLCSTILRKLRNLRRLSTYKIDMEQVMLYLSYPADLQEFNVIRCFRASGVLLSQIGRKMKNLHKLQIVDNDGIVFNSGVNLNLGHWPNMESLKLQISMYATNVCLQAANNLKQLDIQLEDMECLKQLPLTNLKVLHLELFRDADNLFPILTKSCANLETLSLSYVRFLNLTTLSLPPKVTELSFHNCEGLAHSCLKRILSEFKIIKFCSRQTQYKGEYHDFQISSHIQSLEIDDIKMAELGAYENNSQLKELICEHVYLSGETDDVPFNRTPNLQRLDIPYISAVGALTQLNSLQSLKLKCSDSLIEWCDIVDLLKHPTLHELSICNTCDDSLNFQPLVLPEISLQTNITRVTITPDILKAWMQFWLEIFSTNMQMKLLVCCSLSETSELSLAKELVVHGNFPRRLKTMDVSCFTIDCEKLRRNFDAVKYKYPKFYVGEDETGCKNLKMARTRRIVLSWKYEYNL